MTLEVAVAVLILVLGAPVAMLVHRTMHLERRLSQLPAPGEAARAELPAPSVADPELPAATPPAPKPFSIQPALERGEALTLAPGIQFSLAQDGSASPRQPLPRSLAGWVRDTTAQLIPQLQELAGPRKFTLVFSEETMRGIRETALLN